MIETLKKWKIADFENFNAEYAAGKYFGSEARPYALPAIRKWIQIRDDLTYVDDAYMGSDWEALPIKTSRSKYGTNYIFVDMKNKLWRIRTTGSEFYDGPDKIMKVENEKL